MKKNIDISGQRKKIKIINIYNNKLEKKQISQNLKQRI